MRSAHIFQRYCERSSMGMHWVLFGAVLVVSILGQLAVPERAEADLVFGRINGPNINEGDTLIFQIKSRPPKYSGRLHIPIIIGRDKQYTIFLAAPGSYTIAYDDGQPDSLWIAHIQVTSGPRRLDISFKNQKRNPNE